MFSKIIDFGLSHTYVKKEEEEKKDDRNLPDFLKNGSRKHIENVIGSPYHCFKGNMLFSSKYAFMGYTLSRRDDIISILYILIFLINGKIP